MGGLAGVFYGVQLLSSIARDKRDYRDTIAAGLATGLVFGVACAYSCCVMTGYSFSNLVAHVCIIQIGWFRFEYTLYVPHGPFIQQSLDHNGARSIHLAFVLLLICARWLEGYFTAASCGGALT